MPMRAGGDRTKNSSISLRTPLNLESSKYTKEGAVSQASETFRAVASTYENLKCPDKRADYDSRNIASCKTSSVPNPMTAYTYNHYVPGLSIYNTIPFGKCVTLHNFDLMYNYLSGIKGSVVSFQH